MHADAPIPSLRRSALILLGCLPVMLALGRWLWGVDDTTRLVVSVGLGWLAVAATVFSGLVAARARSAGLLGQALRAAWIPMLLITALSTLPLLLIGPKMLAVGLVAMVIPLLIVAVFVIGFAFALALSWRLGDALADHLREPMRA